MDESSPDAGEVREGAGGPTVGVVVQTEGMDGNLAPAPQAPPSEAARATVAAAAEATAPPAPDGALHHHLEVIYSRLEALHQDFESKLKYDEAKDRQLDALHKELQAHRDDLHFKILRPVLMDLIAMYDDMHSIARHDEGRDAGELSEAEVRMRRNQASFIGTIEEILERYGVSAFNDEGDTISPQRQRSIKQVDTDDAAHDRRIAQRLRKGFCHGDKVLRPEIVTTYRAGRKAAAAPSTGGEA